MGILLPTRCRFCKRKRTSLGGIETTLGWFCYDCIKLIHKIADHTAALRDRPIQKILNDIDQTA